jgi:hypothetical protein
MESSHINIIKPPEDVQITFQQHEIARCNQIVPPTIPKVGNFSNGNAGNLKSRVLKNLAAYDLFITGNEVVPKTHHGSHTTLH